MRTSLRSPLLGSVLLSLALAALLCLPALGGGFLTDDYALIGGARGLHLSSSSPFDLYRFASGDPAEITRLIRLGTFPWWTLPTLKLAFFRPLASALFLVDHALFGLNPLGHHLHSIVWYLALVAAAAALFRRALPSGLAALALLLFVVDDTHAMGASWLSGRHAVVATALALLGLYAHVRRREDGLRFGLPLSLAGLAAGLAGGETALGVFGYLAAYELFAAPGAPRERLRAIAPAGALAAAYLALYRALGCGVHGAGEYLDPIGEPARLITEGPARLAALVGGLFANVPIDVWLQQPSSHRPLAIAGVIAGALFAALLWHAWPTLDEAEAKAVRWLGVGALLSLVPALGGAIGSRLLIVPSVGGAALVSIALRHTYRLARGLIGARGAGRALGALGVLVLGLLHLISGLVMLPGLSWMFTSMTRRYDAIARSAEFERRPEVHVVALVSPDMMLNTQTMGIAALDPSTRPASWATLSMSWHDHRVTRTGPRSFELSVIGGAMLEGPLEQVYRRPEEPISVGYEVDLPALRVRVVETKDGRPTRIEVFAATPLEDPSLSFVALLEGKLRRVAMPAQGGSLDLPASFAPVMPR